jgi:signal peptide peptidase SppA
MKLLHVLQAVLNEPWVITESAHAKIRMVVQAKLAGARVSDEYEVEATAKDQFQLTGDTGNLCAIVPIHGIIGKGVSGIERSSGMVGVEQISADIDAAMADDNVSCILLDIDSPGGSVRGVPELGDKIREANETKPVLAFTDGQMDSGAYWLAAGARAIYASRGSEVGSIGVYIPWADETRAYEQEGVSVKVIKNKEGTFKGMGLPGTALTAEQEEHLQKRVQDIFSDFTTHILASRKVSMDAMRGQSFRACDALECGLIDQVSDFETAVRDCLLLDPPDLLR